VTCATFEDLGSSIQSMAETKTLLIYALHIDAGMLVPQRLIRRSQEKELPEVLVAIRDRLASQKASGLCCGAVEVPLDAPPVVAVPVTPVVAP